MYVAGTSTLIYPATCVFGSTTLPVPAVDQAMYVAKLGEGKLVVTLTPPLVVSPLTGTQLKDTTVNLVWDAVANAISYELQVSTDSTFSGTSFLELTGLTDTTHLVVGLQHGTIYYWRARALVPGSAHQKGAVIQANVYGPWSIASSFKTLVQSGVRSDIGIAPGSISNYPNPCTTATTFQFTL